MVIEKTKNNPMVIHWLEKEIKWHKKQRRRDKRKKEKKRRNRMSRSHPISDDETPRTIKENSTR
jgi:transposase